MWKRGGELPELALAQIRDRVGYKSRPFHQRRMSIIAGRAPPPADLRSTAVLTERPDTFFTVEEGDEEEKEEEEEEEGKDNDDAASQHSDNPKDDEQDEQPETGEADDDNAPANSPNSGDNSSSSNSNNNNNKSQELNDEFRRLHLASRERELTRRRSLLAQLQSEEDAAIAAVDDSRRRSKDPSPLEQQTRMWRRNSRVTRSAKAVGDVDVDVSDANPTHETAAHYGPSDEVSDSTSARRRRLRVKTRVATADPSALNSSDDESDRDIDADEGGDPADVTLRVGMTQQERDAAFQKLLSQYLGLLQCAPAEVARRLQVP
ncbi:tigger transposable element-derived protein 6-like [Phytophthora cinnamomi]|uniref:tigger transposable element-derived protein 6-like n=1 Tax=Phytophthora cinnamomi TaxID=4785 RepID=UPI00355A68E8|nr:tigger transposable element-derived protein 6-like [Phytophthora cinnamomi]